MILNDNSKKWIRYIFMMGIITEIFIFGTRYHKDLIFSGFDNLKYYNQAFSIIMTLSFVLADGVMLSLIMTYREIEEKEGREKVFSHISNSLNTIGILSFMAGVIAIVFLSRKGPMENFLSLGILIIPLSIIKIIFTAFLQMDQGFLAGSRGNLARGIIYFLYIFIFREKLGLEGFMIIGVLAAIVQVAIAYYGVKGKGYTYKIGLDFKNKYLKKTLRRSFYIIISLALMNSIDPGGDYGGYLGIFFMTFVSAIVTVIYPLMCQEYYSFKEGHKKELQDNFLWVFDFIIKAFIPFIIVVEITLNTYGDKLSTQDFNIYYIMGLLASLILPHLIRLFMSFDKFRLIGLSSIGFYLLGRGGKMETYALVMVLASLFYIIVSVDYLEVFKDYEVGKYFFKYAIYSLVLLGSVYLVDLLDLKNYPDFHYLLKLIIAIGIFFLEYNRFEIREKQG